MLNLKNMFIFLDYLYLEIIMNSGLLLEMSVTSKLHVSFELVLSWKTNMSIVLCLRPIKLSSF